MDRHVSETPCRCYQVILNTACLVPGDLHLCCVTERLSRCNHRLARFWEETIGRVNPQIRQIVNYLTFSGSIKVAAAETMNHLVVEDKWILKMERKIETFSEFSCVQHFYKCSLCSTCSDGHAAAGLTRAALTVRCHG